MKMLFDYKALFVFKKLKLVLVLGLLFSSSAVLADKIHDPTLPKVNLAPVEQSLATEQQDELALQGIVNKRGIQMAFISGELVKVGDSVRDFKVSKINNNNVVLLKSGSQKRLYVYEK